MNTTAKDAREQARHAYRESLASGAGLSGKALGERFGRSERWGRERIAETRSDLPPLDWPAEGGSRDTNAAAESMPGAQWVAWLGFLFGSVMSIAANVLHAWLPAGDRAGWSPSIATQIGSAVWPIALLLSVEVLSRVRWSPGLWWALARYGGAGTVALGSAVISYGHLHELLIAWDYGLLGAAVGPLVLDGLMVVSGFALLAMSRRSPESADSVTIASAGSGDVDE